MSSDTPDSPLPLSSNETIPEATRHPNPLYKLLHPGIGHIGRRITGYLGSEGQMNATIASRFLQDLVKPHIPNLNVIKESKKEEDAAHYFCRRVRRFELYSRSGSIATPTISQVLDSLTDLRELVLDLPGMDDHLYKILADQYRHLTQLSFGSRVCNISLLFPPQKRTFVNLVGLSLNIGHEWHHYRHLGDILSSDLPMLRDLDLSFVALDDDFDDLYFFPDEKFHALCDFFNQTWDRLRSLALRACPFAYFANPPSKHCYPNLREVTFQDCEDFWFICSKFINECPNISPSDCVWDDYITIMDRFPNLRELRHRMI
ncbi:hypothetical protein H4R33_002733 [Dimargaris cristalligena]|nr:hypothetical protein H4R33_002733 [Dimargaris cristalligena]